MKVREVASELGIDDRTVNYWISKGKMLGPFFEKNNLPDGRFFYTVNRDHFNNFKAFYGVKK
jgi:predicted transcriptional regulator